MGGVVSRGAAWGAAGVKNGGGNLAEAFTMQQQLVRVPFHEEAAIAGVPSTSPASEEARVLWAYGDQVAVTACSPGWGLVAQCLLNSMILKEDFHGAMAR